MGDAYRVLARKYRPQDFSALIGQETMVRVLRNAFERDRIHHAYVLTGVRGVGKTTTARIIAKGLNCTGPDGTGGPTVEPCGKCSNCTAIMEGRHIDVIEMDAASHTGIDDVREITELTRTPPSIARYKVFIIDETHMLSKQAFNGLLKTLEEPPAHVKFLFATTEIRKMPVTVLSRCQRFDLRRIEPEMLIDLMSGITAKEEIEIGQEALALIARAAEGSARDALSLLDQAIANNAPDTEGVRAMLGLADRGRVLDLFAAVMGGDAKAALLELRDQVASGAEPEAVLRDMAETAHWLSTCKIDPTLARDPALGGDAVQRGGDMAGRLSMRILARTWQMLLKAIEETGRAPNPMQAVEMAIIRLCAVADLPSPEELIRQIQSEPASAPAPRAAAPSTQAPSTQAPAPSTSQASAAPTARSSGGGPALATNNPAPRAFAEMDPLPQTDGLPQTFEDLVALIDEKRDGVLLYDVQTGVRLVSYTPGRLEFRPTGAAPADLASRLTKSLSDWTGARFLITISDEDGAPTIAETRAQGKADLEARVRKNALVAAALAAFPGAEIRAIPMTPLETPEPPPGDPDDPGWTEDDDLFGEE